MSEQASEGMTTTEFLAWQRQQEDRYEFVDGQPIAMAGAQLRHDRIKVNVLAEIRRQFRASGNDCDAFTDDIGIVTQGGRIRRPEVSVLCPPFDEEAMVFDRPRLIVEVLSKSTERVDLFLKLDEYKSIHTVDYILYISPLAVEVAFWSRDATHGWKGDSLTDPESVIEMPRLGLAIKVSALYERVSLVPRAMPRLVLK